MIQFIRETLNYLSSLPYHLDQLFSQAGIIPYLILWINLISCRAIPLYWPATHFPPPPGTSRLKF